MNNLLANLPPSGQDEFFEELLRGDSFRAERIVSCGHTTPAGEWYDQGTDEWVLLVAGAARLQFEQPPRSLELRAGDYINIPAHQRHRVAWTDPNRPTVWLAVHYQSHENGEAFIEQKS